MRQEVAVDELCLAGDRRISSGKESHEEEVGDGVSATNPMSRVRLLRRNDLGDGRRTIEQKFAAKAMLWLYKVRIEKRARIKRFSSARKLERLLKNGKVPRPPRVKETVDQARVTISVFRGWSLARESWRREERSCCDRTYNNLTSADHRSLSHMLVYA